MPTLGPTELIIILLIVVVLFGANRIGDLIGGIGKGVRQFRAEVREADPDRGSPPQESA